MSLNPTQDAILEAMDALALFTNEKMGSTAALTALVRAFNRGASIEVLRANLAVYVQVFNRLTALSDALRSKTAAANEIAGKVTFQLENLTDGQVMEMQKSPAMYYSAGYLAIVNSLLFFPKEQALAIIDMQRTDLIQDVENAWADKEAGVTPDVPRIAQCFEAGHALDIVKRALIEASEPDAQVNLSIEPGKVTIS